MKYLGIIPARYESSRYPGKPLVNILGKPLILHVVEKAVAALGNENTIVATDSIKILDVVKKAGFEAILTSDKHLTGTDRLWEVAQKIKADIYINIQGDEPLVNPKDIVKVAKLKEANKNYVINGMASLSHDEDPNNINIPKVLVNSKNDLIYMSRLPIPGVKSKIGKEPKYLKQVCIYAFSYSDLEAFGSQKNKADFEAFEDIEILRFMELGIPIKMVQTDANTIAVDVPDDVNKVIDALSKLI